MSWLKEFRDFAIEGHIVDLPIGAITGAAFSAIVSSLVDVVCMPVSRLMLGQFSAFTLSAPMDHPNGVAVVSSAPAVKPDSASRTIGLFINHVVKFLIAAFVSFLVVRGINTIGNRQAAA